MKERMLALLKTMGEVLPHFIKSHPVMAVFALLIIMRLLSAFVF